MNVIFIKSSQTLMALHETYGKVGDVISLYSAIDGSFIEDCVIKESK